LNKLFEKNFKISTCSSNDHTIEIINNSLNENMIGINLFEGKIKFSQNSNSPYIQLCLLDINNNFTYLP
jgi:hypothetical protein